MRRRSSLRWEATAVQLQPASCQPMFLRGSSGRLFADVLLTIASGRRIHAEHGRAPKRGFAFREAAWEKSECSLTPFASVI